MADIAMPRLSDSMEEGTILKWLKADGDAVERGEELVEIETDKANMTFEADAAGTLEIVAHEGATLPVGEPIARLGDGSAAAPAEAREPESEPDAAEADEEESAQAGNGNGTAKASPVARRMARERGLELAALTGSGPGGRIVKADVEAAGGAPADPEPAPAPAHEQAPAAAAAPAGDGGGVKGKVTVQELTRLQQVVARRMAESKATAPEFVLHAEVEMDAAVEIRRQLKAAALAAGRPAPSFNDMIVKACALALRDIPRANGAYRDGRFELYGRINVGIAVAGQDALVVPTIHDADRKTLGEIAHDSRVLAERVRAGAITPPELAGGTFTVSNLGMFGVTSFTAVINPPQAAILAVGAMSERAVVRDGALTTRHVLDLTLTCDHRILYGADAARFLVSIRELLEQPLTMAL